MRGTPVSRFTASSSSPPPLRSTLHCRRPPDRPRRNSIRLEMMTISQQSGRPDSLEGGNGASAGASDGLGALSEMQIVFRPQSTPAQPLTYANRHNCNRCSVAASEATHHAVQIRRHGQCNYSRKLQSTPPHYLLLECTV